ncbi:MAG: SIR2 family NAD-dependent protein deacylase [Bacteroidota bacterium]
MKKKLVVLTGAGMSQESGLRTFRDTGGTWEHYRVEDVATPEAWRADPELVLRFYNERRKDLMKALPNSGHTGLAQLEKYFDVYIITQNVDNLHEQAGSSQVLHLHGELMKVRSTRDPELIYELDHWELNLGDRCELGSQLRPHIVWFGEAVPNFYLAIPIVEEADILVVIGTSMVVYPAAGLVDYARPGTPVYVIDPGEPALGSRKVTLIPKKASEGVQQLIEILTENLDINNEKS